MLLISSVVYVRITIICICKVDGRWWKVYRHVHTCIFDTEAPHFFVPLRASSSWNLIRSGARPQATLISTRL
jgi:hypothetical protein